MKNPISEVDNILRVFMDKLNDYESNLTTYYANFKTTIDFYEKEYNIDINGIII